MTSFFQMVNETKYGCSILVSSVAKPTVAKLSLEDPSEVFALLPECNHEGFYFSDGAISYGFVTNNLRFHCTGYGVFA